MWTLLGALLGSILVFAFRRLLKIVIPMLAVLWACIAVAIGGVIEHLARGSDLKVVGAIVAFGIIVVSGVPMVIFTMIHAAEDRLEILEKRAQRIEEYLEESTRS